MHSPVLPDPRNLPPTKPTATCVSLLGLACAGAALAAQAQAQTQTDPPMPVVEVIGTTPLPGIGIDRNLLPYPVQTAGERERKGARAGNLSEYMAQNLTGVNVNEVQGSPFQNDLTFRGYRASPLLGAPQGISVFLDGVRINEGFGDVINWDMLPEAAIASVTLVPGANPTYGLNSLGGALAFRTKSGRTDPGFEADVSLGSFGRKRIDLGYGAQFEDGWHAFVAGTRFIEDGWRDYSNGRLGNVFAKFGRSSGRDNWDLSLLHGSSTLVGNGLLPDELYEDDRRTVYTHPDRSRNRVHQLAFNAEHWLDSSTVVAALVYGRNSRRSTVNGDINPAYESYAEACEGGFDAGGAPVEDDECVDNDGNPLTRAAALGMAPGVLNQTHTRQRSYGFGLNLARDVGIHKFSVGASAERSRVRYEQTTEDAGFDDSRGAVAFPGAEPELDAAVRGHAWNAALYASNTMSLSGATHLTASARYNVAKVTNTLTNENGVQPTESFRYTKLNPALGITHQIGSGWTLFANLAQNTRVPTVIELGCADPEQPCALPTGLQADPFLEQVTSRTIEAGARLDDNGRGRVSVSVYQSVNRDDILFLRAGATQLGYFDNFERTRHRGVDLSAQRNLGPFAARLGYSYLDATYDADGSLFAGERTVQVRPGTRIAGLPRHTLKLGLDWRPSAQWMFGADLVAVSSLVTQGNEDGLLEDPEDDEPLATGDAGIAGHAVLALRASYKPTRQLEFYARINNALDRRYETYGVLAENMFPDGQLVQPALGTGEAEDARFVAPGAPRSFSIGMNYKF
ncbi:MULTISPECIES: TonB-dependent receptor [unclassified Massilia]|uniref:TonB-dependent receptor n=1 Tax=unclassified Massilia TaxID=2609279 RepID=UPI00177EE81D|nr:MULTISPECIES: TonB-dependent receptor [unclassified Massilia]MBD8530374.1 TonB-dependent receptor [Massilia sp. CFBP 13647]MBD8673151.1 TonB-dependent receptor [Massilia sp. CFBP 13721]